MPKQCHVASVISNQHSRKKNVEKNHSGRPYTKISKNIKKLRFHIFSNKTALNISKFESTTTVVKYLSYLNENIDSTCRY